MIRPTRRCLGVGARCWKRGLELNNLGLVLISLGLVPPLGAADEPLRLECMAPPNHVAVRNARGGAYFVPRELKQKYDELLANIAALRAKQRSDSIDAVKAGDQLHVLRATLDERRKEIDAKMVLVTGARLHTQTEEFSFELGDDKLLVITADDVRVRPSNDIQVKCVLEKTVLGIDDQSEMGEFDAIRVVHRQGTAPELVGRTLAESLEDERKFRASDGGRALTDAQRESRRVLVNEIQESYAPFRDFQGKELDVIHIDGLTHEQGNRQILMRMESEGGDRLATSGWRRHARLTVFVPRCRGVVLRGCLAGLDVQDLPAPLTVTDSGSTERDYSGVFKISGVDGPLQLYNVPLDRLEQVHGDVTIVSTVGFANTGTHHQDGWRIAYSPPPHECTVSGVDGDFSAWFAREILYLEKMAGQIDVKNESGDTTLTLTELAANAAHRVISDSGLIEVRGSAAVVGGLPVIAVTSGGSVRTNAAQHVLDEVNFSTGNPYDGTRRNWRGLRSAQKPNPAGFFEQFGRPAAVLANEPRAAGLDLISRSGAIVVAIEP